MAFIASSRIERSSARVRDGQHAFEEARAAPDMAPDHHVLERVMRPESLIAWKVLAIPFRATRTAFIPVMSEPSKKPSPSPAPGCRR